MLNPYQAPRSTPVPVPTKNFVTKGQIWRDGTELVVEKNTPLPPFCVKTNEPEAKRVKRRFYWHGALFDMASWKGGVWFNLVALAFSQRHVLKVPLSKKAIGKRRVEILIGWFGVLLGLGCFGGALLWADDAQEKPGLAHLFVVIGSIGLFMVGGKFAQLKANILKTTKMTKSKIWFKGACEEYLQRFQELPPQI